MNLLIVEDDKDMLDALSESFRENGFVVDSAEDGERGLYKASINDYDAIILDINLPKKDGRQVCSEIRSAGKNTPIIMLSVKYDVDTKVDLLNIGADDYLSKPFSYVELSARVKALLRRPRDIIKGDVFCIDDLTLDTKKRTVIRDGKKIHLTPKDFFLLEFLMRNRGTVMPRMAILEHVWDLEADLFTNTIETHIATIRKKINFRNKRDLIQTISSGGYKIE
jgi:two-component system OmpR family response regulator